MLGKSLRTACDRWVRPNRFGRLVAFLGLCSDPAKVIALSAGGIRLLVGYSFRGERSVTLELSNRSRSFSRLLPIRVARVRPTEAGYVLDGRFTAPFSEHELHALLS
jgi:hypothetical protein